jgi:hypothetical protein
LRLRHLLAIWHRRAFWQQCAIVVLVAAGVSLTVRYLGVRRDRMVGKQLSLRAETALSLYGKRTPLLARDSLTTLVVTDAHCEACRLGARSFVRWARRRRAQGMAVRILTTSDLVAAAQYARLSRDTLELFRVDSAVYRRLGITVVPTVVVLDARGVIQSYATEWAAGPSTGSVGASR